MVLSVTNATITKLLFSWQVKAGTIFDNILITDDEDFARNVAKETFEESAKGEKEKKEAKDEVSKVVNYFILPSLGKSSKIVDHFIFFFTFKFILLVD